MAVAAASLRPRFFFFFGGLVSAVGAYGGSSWVAFMLCVPTGWPGASKLPAGWYRCVNCSVGASLAAHASDCAAGCAGCSAGTSIVGSEEEDAFSALSGAELGAGWSVRDSAGAEICSSLSVAHVCGPEGLAAKGSFGFAGPPDVGSLIG